MVRVLRIIPGPLTRKAMSEQNSGGDSKRAFSTRHCLSICRRLHFLVVLSVTPPTASFQVDKDAGHLLQEGAPDPPCRSTSTSTARPLHPQRQR